MKKKNQTIFKILKHKKCRRTIRGNVFSYSINSLKIQVPSVIGKMINDLVAKRADHMLRQLIIVHKDKIHTNFGD